MLPRFQAGQFITFVYNPPAKPPPKQPARPQQVPDLDPTGKPRLGPDGKPRMVTQAVRPQAPPPPPSDPNKEVMVIHPNWQGKVHAIDLKRLTPAEVQTLRAVMDPKVKAAVDAGQWPVEGAPPYPLVKDILMRMDPVELIKNPLAFYTRLVKPFIRNKDVYRQYFPTFVSNVKVVEESKVQGNLTNPAPLFKKI